MIRNKFILGMILFLGLFVATGKGGEIVEETFLFCLRPEVQPLQIEKNDDGFLVDIPELNVFFKQYNIVNIEPWIPGATDMDRDGDIYLNRIYRVYLSEKNRQVMTVAKESITAFPFIHSSEFENIRKPFFQPNDSQYGQQCSMTAMKANMAWDFWDIDAGDLPGDRTVLLASVDTGVDYTHPDLQDNIWINQNEIPSSLFNVTDMDGDGYVESGEVVAYLENNNLDTNNDGVINLRDALTSASPYTNNQDNDGNGMTDDIIGWDHSGWSGADDNDPYPRENVPADGTWAHGTHVAGILGATSNNNLGIASAAFNVSVIPIKCSREYQESDPYVNDGYAGITYAAKAGYYSGTFTIINCSWGGTGYNSYEQTTINNAFNTYGAVIVGAAGNGLSFGGEEYSAHYPSSYQNVVSVCAMGCAGTWGYWATYHSTVDIAAPGENILSTIIGTGYQAWDGSSMASPNAASSIGLLKAYYPEWTNQQLVQKIIESADDVIYEINDAEYLQGNLGSGMVDVHKAIGSGVFPYLYYYSYNLVNLAGDGDNILNPGESTQLRVTLGNETGWTDAVDVTAVLTTDNPGITITDAEAAYGTIYAGGIQMNIVDLFEFEISEDVELGMVDFIIEASAANVLGEQITQMVPLSIEVSLNQEGWPVRVLADTLNNVETSPLILDADNDGEKEIYFGDYSGYLYAVRPDGSMITNNLFPFDTGNQIWGSPAASDIDNDGNVEIIITSKSRHLYILDPVDQIVQVDYDSGQYLMGTAAIGNIDDDDDLEVIVGGFSSPGKIFAVNPDGTDVPGFPYVLGEKMIRGVALADFNDNGKVDIVCATESYNIWVIYDDTTVAPGFPFTALNKFRSAPAVLQTDAGKIIFAGNRDQNFYAVNEDGSLRFSVGTGDYVLTSPAFVQTDSGVGIFFGSLDGGLYGVDTNGDPLDGWPVMHGGSIVTSPVISDLNGDGLAEIISGTQLGEMTVYNFDGTGFMYFPIMNEYGYSGTPTVEDTDNDGDLEILLGSTGNMSNIDFKLSGNSQDYWNMLHGDMTRAGYFSGQGGSGCGCNLGDVNCDGSIDVLDVVRTVFIIVNDPPDAQECERILGDVNEDDILDVLDLVVMVNMIMNP